MKILEIMVLLTSSAAFGMGQAPTVCSSPSPIPTVTVTVTPLPSPAPTVTVTASPTACVPSPSPKPSSVASPTPSPSVADSAPTLVSPKQGSILAAYNTTFVFKASGATSCTVSIGSTPGGYNFAPFFNNVPCNQVVVTTIPSSNETVWVRVWANYPDGSSIGGGDFQFVGSAPVPLPSPSTAGTCSTIGAITGLPYCTYAATSTWNQPIPLPSPSIDPNSSAMISGVMQNYPQNGAFQINDSTWNAFPTYFTKSGDPVVTIAPSASYGNVSGSVPMPVNVSSGPAPDSHMVVLNSSSGSEWDYYGISLPSPITSGTTIPVVVAGLTNYQSGSGWGEVTTAAGAGLMAGLVTVDEMMSGTIHHALAMAPACNNGYEVSPQLPAVYPATANAAFNCPVSKGNGIPHGSRIWSDLTDAQVNALGLDNISSMILKALYHYGGFVTDTNGMVGLDVRNIMEQPLTPTGQIWLNQNGWLGTNVPAINKQPVSFFTSHFHVLAVCVTKGGC